MRRRKKKSIQSILFSQTSLTLIGFLVIVLISIPFVRNIQKQLNVNNEISALNQEVEDLEKKNTEWKSLLSYLNSDQFTEEQARLNLNYKKEGEEVVIIKSDDFPSETTLQDNSQNLNSMYSIKGLENRSETNKQGNMKNWFNYFWN